MNISEEQDSRTERLEVPNSLWLQTWRLLSQMGQGESESACVWGGTLRHGRLCVVKAYPIGAAHGAIRGCQSHRMSTQGVAELLAELRKDGLRIVADVHTHPSSWVGLSEVDKAHPIEFRRGLICIVLPDYATTPPSLESIGLHIYLGEGRWLESSQAETAVRVVLV